MRVAAHRQHADDQVRHPPRDRRERLGLRWRVGEVDAAVGMDGPAVRHRLPEVLVVGQALQTWPQLRPPVEVELVDQFVGDVHDASVAEV